MSGGYQINIRPEGYFGGLKRFLRMFYLYQSFSGIHPIDVPGHIRLFGDGKYSYNPQEL